MSTPLGGSGWCESAVLMASSAVAQTPLGLGIDGDCISARRSHDRKTHAHRVPHVQRQQSTNLSRDRPAYRHPTVVRLPCPPPSGGRRYFAAVAGWGDAWQVDEPAQELPRKHALLAMNSGGTHNDKWLGLQHLHESVCSWGTAYERLDPQSGDGAGQAAHSLYQALRICVCPPFSCNVDGGALARLDMMRCDR